MTDNHAGQQPFRAVVEQLLEREREMCESAKAANTEESEFTASAHGDEAALAERERLLREKYTRLQNMLTQYQSQGEFLSTQLSLIARFKTK